MKQNDIDLFWIHVLSKSAPPQKKNPQKNNKKLSVISFYASVYCLVKFEIYDKSDDKIVNDSPLWIFFVYIRSIRKPMQLPAQPTFTLTMPRNIQRHIPDVSTASHIEL